MEAIGLSPIRFPILQSPYNTIMDDDGSDEESMEPLPLDGLDEFPAFFPIASHKRCAQDPRFPAKRFKGLSHLTDCTFPSSQMKEGSSWMASFLLLDPQFPYEDAASSTSYHDHFMNHHDTEESTSVDELVPKALDVSIPGMFKGPQATTPRPITQVNAESNNNEYLQDSSHLRLGTLQHLDAEHHHHHQARVIDPSAPVTDNGIIHQPRLVTPAASPMKSLAAQQHVPEITMPQPKVDTTGFTLATIRNSNEPTLLTLTSFPFRVIYQNEAYSKQSSDGNKSVIGDSIFDTFKVEDQDFRVSFAAFPTLTNRLDDKIVLIPFHTDEKNNEYSVRYEIQVQPVTKRRDSTALRYYAARFTAIK